MLASLMRAMKPKILESFKDYNTQKEFLAKLSVNKHVTVVVKDNKNIITQPYNSQINNYLKSKRTIIVYKINHKAKD